VTRCIDLFIDAPMPLGELAEALGRLCGLTFVGDVAGERWTVQDAAASAELIVHHLHDDRHLALETYPFDLFAHIERIDGVERADRGATELLRSVFAAVRADGRFRALLVFDLQHVLDRTGSEPAAEPS